MSETKLVKATNNNENLFVNITMFPYRFSKSRISFFTCMHKKVTYLQIINDFINLLTTNVPII